MSDADELWGTFALDDHLRKRAYVADVILFDRVVVPKPPEGDKEQWREWIKNGWKPGRLKRILEELGELAVPVPWTEQNRELWRTTVTSYYDSLPAEARAESRMRIGQYAAIDAGNIKKAPEDSPSRYVTRAVLADTLNDREDKTLYDAIKGSFLDPAAEIEAVVGYGSLSKFQNESGLDISTKPEQVVKGGSLLFGWEFLIPGDSDLTDIELLERAVRLSRKNEFSSSRREFHEWRRKLAANKVSPDVARAEMERCLVVYNDIVAKSHLRRRVLTALQVTTVLASAADFVVPGLGTGTSVVLGTFTLAAERLVPDPKAAKRERVAALVHDSRKAFGWRSN